MQNQQKSTHPRSPEFLLTLSRALLEALDLQETLYVLLTGVTSGDGLGFNRAFLYLTDSGRRSLRATLAIGPDSKEEAHRIWEDMEQRGFTLETILNRHGEFLTDERASALRHSFQRSWMKLPADGRGVHDEHGDVLARVFATREPFASNDFHLKLPGTDITLHNMVVVPLVLDGLSVGLMAADNPYNERRVTDRDLKEASGLANLCAVAVQRARLLERIKEMANRDGLTGLANRRRFDERFVELTAGAVHTGRPLSLLILDIDDFKHVNDRFGHLAGDALLKVLATTIKSRIRTADLAARYGGDEIVVVLPGADMDAALSVAHAISEDLERRMADTGKILAPTAACTVSIGVAQLEPGDDPEDLIARADRALYEAKAKGKATTWAARKEDDPALRQPSLPFVRDGRPAADEAGKTTTDDST